MENYKPDASSDHKLTREYVLRTITSESRDTLEKLNTIWLELGIKDDQRQTRNETVISLITNLLGDMISEEENLKAQVTENIARFKDVVKTLSSELALENFKVDENLTLIEVETELRLKVDALNKIKHERLKELMRLRTDEEQLCIRLAVPQHELNFVGCPAQEQIRELQQNVGFLQKEMTKRFDLFKKLQNSIQQLWRDLDVDPSTEFEMQLCSTDADDQFCLSADNLNKLGAMQDHLENEHKNLLEEIDGLKAKVEALWERLEVSSEDVAAFRKDYWEKTPKTARALKQELSRLEILKQQHMKRFIDNVRKELLSLWDKCYFSEEQRQDFRPYYEELFTDESLRLHEQQVQTMNNYYQENSTIFKLIEKREIAWKKKVKFENESANGDRLFTARGGALLKEEKLRATFEKGLPKIEKDLTKSLTEWEKDNETAFLYFGVRYSDRMTLQNEEFNALKEMKKQERSRAKQENTKQEMVFGSKPSAVKRKCVGTPVKSPLNQSKRKRMDTTQTPSKYIHSSIHRTPNAKRHAAAGTMPVNQSKPVPLKSALKLKSRAVATARRRSNRVTRQTGRLGKENATFHPSPSPGKSTNIPKTSFVSGSFALPRTPQPAHVGSYHEFSVGIVSPNCRSSFVSKSPNSIEHV